ncbi:MAG: methyltransferase domain-containing protein [Anaerolineae bacterium]|nr:methyltransferase domain-containing protein [Anaerolineae bacterium]
MNNNDTKLNAESREIWDTNAEVWDTKIGGGGGWQSTLMVPTVERMLKLQAGENVLDIACGNGHFSRWMAALGAEVVASDFSPNMITLAQRRTTEYSDRIRYHVVDATDEAQLMALGAPNNRRFDAALCCNALMDMPVIEPLFRAVAKLLTSNGRFVFSIMHPCFNGLSVSMQPELRDYENKPIYSIKVSRYLSTDVIKGLAIREQPKQQYYWHRPLHVLLNSAFNSGLVMDGIEEPPITSDAPSKSAFDWANYDMPPLLFVRLRPAAMG